MKKIYVIISLILLLKISFCQKYRTMEQFQQHFIENLNSIDEIEGIWYLNSTAQINEHIEKQDPEIVAVIKENGYYMQYTLENGYYIPIEGSRKFAKTSSGYQYIRYYDDVNMTSYGDPFYLTGKKFTFKMGMLKIVQKRANNGGYDPSSIWQAYFSYSYSKLFPLDIDIEKNNQINNERDESKSANNPELGNKRFTIFKNLKENEFIRSEFKMTMR